MVVCSNCFGDKEVKGYIESTGFTSNCSFCKTENSKTIELTELMDFFEELFENFQPSENGESLKSIIQGKWSFFASDAVTNEILNELLSESNSDIQNAETSVDYIDDISNNIDYWNALKEDLKWNRRFLVDTTYLEELGWDGFFNSQFLLTREDFLFRARVHHTSGAKTYATSEMSCPPAKNTKGGRANPLGIPYLYLSDNPETVLYEIRASYYDELSIGKFILSEDIESLRIVDFTEIDSLFQPNRINIAIKSRLLKEKISHDLSTPMRRYDTEIDYIPTQFICEFIRIYTGASGVRFRSSLHPKGKNIVIFEEDKMQCADVLLHKVHKVDLRSKEI